MTPLPDRKTAKAIVGSARETLDATTSLLGALSAHERRTLKLYKDARQKNIRIYLDRLPLYALKEVGASGVRAASLQDAGVGTIGEILSRGPRRLQRIRGVGPHSAHTAHDGAKRIQRIAEKKLSVRLDDDVRPKEETKLLDSLVRVREIHVVLGGIEREAVEVDRELGELARRAAPAARWWHRPFLSAARRQRAAAAAEAAKVYLEAMYASGLRDALLAAATRVGGPSRHSLEDLWGTYTAEPETFDSLLRSVVGFIPDDAEQLPLGAPPPSIGGPRDGVTTVYRMFDHRNTLLYVGISNRVDVRIEQHRATKEWFWQVDRIATVDYPNRRAALDAEERAIKAERPVHNIVHNRR